MNDTARIAFAVTALVGAAVAAAPSNPRRKWFDLPVTYQVHAHSAINGQPNFQSAVLPRVQAAFEAWTKRKVSGTSWDVLPQGGGTFTTPSDQTAINRDDGKNQIIWLGGANWTADKLTLAVTVLSYYADGTGEAFDGDMMFNDNFVWSSTGAFNTYDFESVALHEAGHFLGLDHTTSTSAVMYESINAGEQKRALTSLDIDDVRTMYPGSGTAGGQGASCAGGGCQAGLVCRGQPAGSSKICTVDCTSGQACPTGYTCQDADTGKACLVPTGSSDLCRFCTNGSQCQNGNCVTNGKYSWCTIPCSTAAECGAGYTCVPGPSSNVCAPSGTCAGQCTTNANCPTGYACVGGACEATGNVGDRCESSGYCKSCSICVGTYAEAYCRDCCGGQGGGGVCNGCAGTSCSGGQACVELTGINDRACIPTTGATACTACGPQAPCGPGLTCVGGRCHASCNPQSPGNCTACYDQGNGTGICACPDEQRYNGQACGQLSTGGFGACVNGLVCIVQGATTTCRALCNASASGSCPAGQLCTPIGTVAACLPSQTPGSQCNACNGAQCDPGLTCLGGKCYAACGAGCSACVEGTPAGALCGCPADWAGVNASCGYSAEQGVRACQPGLSCIAGSCHYECTPSGPNTCPAGTSCRAFEGTGLCLDPNAPLPGRDGGLTDGGAGGGVVDTGCGCHGGVGWSGLAWLTLVGLAFRRRRR